jgi:hypothetical protein
MALKYTNNASTTLSTGISTSATSVTVADASEFPVIGAGDYTYITLATADATKIEIVKVTLTVGATFTIVRAQDNTTAQAFSSGDLCELRITAIIFKDALDSIVQGISDRKDYTVGTAATPYLGSTTVFPVAYDVGFIDVFLNGAHLDPGDFTATNSSSVTLSSAAASGDVISLIGWGTFKLVNTALTDLNNVNAASPTNGQALTYDTSTSKWVASTAYTHPTGDGNKHVPADSGTSTGKLLTATSTAGSPTWQAAPVSLPSQSATTVDKYLQSDGSSASWQTVPTIFPFYRGDNSVDNIAITNGEFPFYLASGSADNIGVS